MKNVKGACLCGAVKLSFDIKNDHFDACHCGMCRKWGGGPLFSVDAAQNFKIEGESNVGVFDSSEWAQRGFCKVCGSHLFYRLKQNEFHNVPLGILEKPEEFTFHQQIFIDHKPQNYQFADKTKVMTEKEVWELYSPKDA